MTGRIDLLIGEEYLGLYSDGEGNPLLSQVTMILVSERMVYGKGRLILVSVGGYETYFFGRSLEKWLCRHFLNHRLAVLF